MRRAPAFIFAIVFLLQGVVPAALEVCCELQKLPNLFSHFEEHRDMSGETFIEFLAENYFGAGAESHHEQGHENLPFHGSHQCGHSVIFFLCSHSICIAVPEQATMPVSDFLWVGFPSDYLDSPFQPPKA